MAFLQASAFRKIVGDVWYRANRAKLGEDDPVTPLIEEIGWQPKAVLEYGCANGWRLKKLQEKYGCKVVGVEPSQEAIDNRLVHDISCGTAEQKIFANDNIFDTIIYGFCWGFIDPPDYFRVLAEGDRLLKNGGLIILHDRTMPVPIKRHVYGFTATHREHGEHEYEVMLHSMDFPRLWLANPCYKEIKRTLDSETLDFVCVMQKDIENSFMTGKTIPRDDGMQLTDDGHPIYPEDPDHVQHQGLDGIR